MRIEKDSMGEMQVPDQALYGASTQRAVLNFPISGQPMPDGFVRGLGLVKWACATANEELGRMPRDKADLIRAAAEEVYQGKLTEHFPVDIFQTGSGTSSNMNVNEVIANRCSQLMGKPIGSKVPVHPNDHVNMGQSSNDIIPTVLHVSVAVAIKQRLQPALNHLADTLDRKAFEFKDIVKLGRTHMMDATPVTLGQEFGGYAVQVHKAVGRARKCVDVLGELAIGGTAVGTGINCHPEFPGKVCRILSERTGIAFREAANHFEAQGGRDDAVEVSGHLNAIAASLAKITNDIMSMAGGPVGGMAEIRLPDLTPGSSIMPGKVNPVLCEALLEVCFYTGGLANIVGMCGRDGHFELNVTIPMMAHCLHESVHCMSNAMRAFADKCVSGIQPNIQRCRELVDRSNMLATALSPIIGYDKATEVANLALRENKTIQEVVRELKLLDEDAIAAVLDPVSMTKPTL